MPKLSVGATLTLTTEYAAEIVIYEAHYDTIKEALGLPFESELTVEDVNSAFVLGKIVFVETDKIVCGGVKIGHLEFNRSSEHNVDLTGGLSEIGELILEDSVEEPS